MVENEDDTQVDLNNFPGIEETLAEARRRYDNEEDRRSSIEHKIGIIIAVNALLISVGTGLSENGRQLLSVITLSPSLLSALIGIYIIKPKDYWNPLKSPNEYYGYARKDPKDLHDTFLLAYIQAIGYNQKLNQLKMSLLKICTYLTFVSLALVVMSPFISANLIIFISLFLLPLLVGPALFNSSHILVTNFYRTF